MISYSATRSFQKQYSKLPPKIQKSFKERLRLFLTDQSDPRLRIHPLRGKYRGYWSINVTGDVRALFRWEGETIVIFTFIGTRSEIYG